MNLFKTSFFTAISAVFLLFFSSVSGAKSIVEPAKDSEVLDLVFILDKSGSMSGFESDTVGGYNSVLTENRNKAGKTFITRCCLIIKPVYYTTENLLIK